MRGRWSAVLGIVLMVGGLSLLLLIEPPPADAQTLPPEVTYNVSCVKNPTTGANATITYALKLKNPNTTTITYSIVRSWTDGRADNTASRTIDGGKESDANYNNAGGLTTQWTHTLTIKVDGNVVGTPKTVNNPCVAAPTSPPEVTYDVTCKKTTAGVPEAVVYAPKVRNPNTVAVTYTLVRTWNDGRAEVSTTADVAPGVTASGGTLDLTDATGLTTQWTHTLTVKEGSTVVGTPVTKDNPCYSAPAEPKPPEVTFDVTCQKNDAGDPESVLYAPTVKNPNTVKAAYTLGLIWSDERQEKVNDVEVDAGATVSGERVNFTSDEGLTEEWTVTLAVLQGEDVIAGPVTKDNPCYTAPADPTTTTPVPTTSTTDIAAAAAATSGGGSSLAATGVGIAVAVIAGVGLLLFLNGVGLTRLVRKAGDHE